MTFQSTTSTPKQYFVLADSHGRFVPRLTTTPTHQIIIQSISGLKWIDDDQHHLSAFHLLQTYPIFSHLASATAVMFLIGSNSLRKFSASIALNEIQHIISNLRQQHLHLAKKDSIGIVTTFPCFKFSYIFPTPALIQHNINIFNEQLYFLATNLNFRIVDFAIQPYHLSIDQLHIDNYYSNLVSNNIFNYFDRLISTSIPADQQVSRRSNDALMRRNRRRHLRLAEKQACFYICKTVNPSWTLEIIKTYLQQNQIPFAKLSTIRNNQLRIRFNNLHTLQ
ncbi:unnamed protein product, partial [Rotaria sp. Silwood2]